MFGRNLQNTASTQSSDDDESGLTTASVKKLKLKWTFNTGGDVTARAAVVDGVAYFPDYGGNIWAVDADNGKLIWGHKLSDYGLAAGTLSRTSPAVDGDKVYIGTQYNASGPTGWLLAIDAKSGELAWKVQPDTSNPFPVITASPTVADGVVYVGMTSQEEYAAANPTYACCSVRGSVVAINADNGNKLWQTFTVPPGYSGGAVWGSSPVVDKERHTLFISTGNNYSAPTDTAYVNCIGHGGTRAACLSPDDHTDSVVALDLHSGLVKWGVRLTTWNQFGVTDGSDSWNVSCGGFAGPPVNCPTAAGPDYDFGSGPNEITYQTAHGSKTIIGAGQKSGIYYALDPDNGAELWHTQVGPGSSLGGMEWGSATDGKRIYVAIANFYGIPYAAIGRPAALGASGSWAALDPATGNILWQVKDPNGAIDLGPLTVSNGVVFAPSMGSAPTAPTMLALDASTGATLWSYPAGASLIGGASIVGNTVYWGTGYLRFAALGFTGNNKFYAFSSPGENDN